MKIFLNRLFEEEMEIDDNLIFLKSDVILTFGWYTLPKVIREIPTEGVWGLHASLLLDYAGGTPLVWALINGEKFTGTTLFKKQGGVDDGDIIEQEKIIIEEEDTIKTLLAKASSFSRNFIVRVLKYSKIPKKPQDKSKLKRHPQRSPKDGEINWSWDKSHTENFVRAQTKPYP